MQEELVHKVEGAKQEINTGKTIDEIYSAQAEQMTPLTSDAFDKLVETILDFIKKNKNEFYILNSKALNYITIFQKVMNDKYFAEMIAEFLLYDDGLANLGGLKMFTDEDNTNVIHMYVGKTHFALFAADDFVIYEK